MVYDVEGSLTIMRVASLVLEVCECLVDHLAFFTLVVAFLRPPCCELLFVCADVFASFINEFECVVDDDDVDEFHGFCKRNVSSDEHCDCLGYVLVNFICIFFVKGLPRVNVRGECAKVVAEVFKSVFDCCNRDWFVELAARDCLA